MLTVDSHLGVLSTSKMASPNHTNGFIDSYSERRHARYSPTRSSPDRTEQPQQKHMWIVTGPAGCGKSTVAAYLSTELQLPYIEGDDYHPDSNREKMTKGIPLTDIDRWDWLITLRNAAAETLKASPTQNGVVVTCSALKRKYRDVIRVAAYNDHGISVHFIYLHASEQTLMARVAARQGHFMGAQMVHSQFASLEVPGDSEMKDVIAVDVTGPLSEVEPFALEMVKEELRWAEEERRKSHEY